MPEPVLSHRDKLLTNARKNVQSAEENSGIAVKAIRSRRLPLKIPTVVSVSPVGMVLPFQIL